MSVMCLVCFFTDPYIPFFPFYEMFFLSCFLPFFWNVVVMCMGGG